MKRNGWRIAVRIGDCTGLLRLSRTLASGISVIAGPNHQVHSERGSSTD